MKNIVTVYEQTKHQTINLEDQATHGSILDISMAFETQLTLTHSFCLSFSNT